MQACVEGMPDLSWTYAQYSFAVEAVVSACSFAAGRLLYAGWTSCALRYAALGLQQVLSQAGFHTLWKA